MTGGVLRGGDAKGVVVPARRPYCGCNEGADVLFGRALQRSSEPGGDHLNRLA
jgi:hypothetical protein